MENQAQTTKPQRGSVLTRPVRPAMAIFLLATLAIFSLALHPGKRYAHDTRKATESALKGNLQEIRNAIEQFYDDTGRNPVALKELLASDAHHLLAPVEKGNSYMGPYLTPQGGISNSGIPWNPLIQYTDELQPLDNAIIRHWRYDAKSGQVHSAVAGTTLEGQSYQSL